MGLTPLDGLGPTVGLYSHAVPIPPERQLLCISGQLSVDDQGESVAAGDFEAQMLQVFDNIGKVVTAAGAEMSDIAKMTTYLTDPDHISEFYRVREGLFAELFPSGQHPGNTLLVVSRLVRPEFLIEIEALAAMSPGGPT